MRSKLENHLSAMYGLSSMSARDVVSEGRDRLSMRKWQKPDHQLWELCDLLSQTRGVREQLLSPSEKEHVIVFSQQQQQEEHGGEATGIEIETTAKCDEDEFEEEIQKRIRELEQAIHERHNQAMQENILQEFRPPAPIVEGEEGEETEAEEKTAQEDDEEDDVSLTRLFQKNSRLISRNQNDENNVSIIASPKTKATVQFHQPKELSQPLFEKSESAAPEIYVPADTCLPPEHLSTDTKEEFAEPPTPKFVSPSCSKRKERTIKLDAVPVTPTFCSPEFSRMCATIKLYPDMESQDVTAPMTPSTPLSSSMTPITPCFVSPSFARKSPRRTQSNSSTISKKPTRKVPWAVFLEDDCDDDMSSVGDASVNLPFVKPPDDDDDDDEDKSEEEKNDQEDESPSDALHELALPQSTPTSPQPPISSPTESPPIVIYKPALAQPISTLPEEPTSPKKPPIGKPKQQNSGWNGLFLEGMPEDMLMQAGATTCSTRSSLSRSISREPLLRGARPKSCESPAPTGGGVVVCKSSPKSPSRAARFLPWSPTPCSVKLEGTPRKNSRRAMTSLCLSPRASSSNHHHHPSGSKKKIVKRFSPWVNKRKSMEEKVYR